MALRASDLIVGTVQRELCFVVIECRSIPASDRVAGQTVFLRAAAYELAAVNIFMAVGALRCGFCEINL